MGSMGYSMGDTMRYSMGYTPPNPVQNAKIIKGWYPQDAPLELVPQLYKAFPNDHFGREEMKKPTRLRNKNSTA